MGTRADLIPDTDAERWEDLLTVLERHAPHLGPVLGWDGERTSVTVSAERGNEEMAEATQGMTAAVSEALVEAGLGVSWVRSVEVEMVGVLGARCPQIGLRA